MSVVLLGSTSGSVTLQEPAVAGTTIISLPSVSMNMGNGAGGVATNTAFGASALEANTSGANNTAVGQVALDANTTGSLNVAFGVNTLGLNTTGSENSAIGVSSLSANTTGSYNTALGRSALGANTTASNNTAVGYQAGYTNTTGTGSNYVGRQAGYSSNANYNTMMGDQAGYSSTGIGNTFFGYYAGGGATSATYNTFVGYGAGNAITTGGKHTILGCYNGNSGGLDIRTASNYIVLSDGDGNPRMRMNGFGLFCPEVYSVTGVATANVYVDGSGNLYRATSSLKYKTDVQDSEHGLADAMKLRSVTYKSKKESESGIIFGGLIAEEVHEAGLTEFVQYAEDGTPDAIHYANMVALAFKAIQELKADLDATKAELAALKGTA
jgi:trimeric autotransporter adhesin